MIRFFSIAVFPRRHVFECFHMETIWIHFQKKLFSVVKNRSAKSWVAPSKKDGKRYSRIELGLFGFFSTAAWIFAFYWPLTWSFSPLLKRGSKRELYGGNKVRWSLTQHRTASSESCWQQKLLLPLLYPKRNFSEHEASFLTFVTFINTSDLISWGSSWNPV